MATLSSAGIGSGLDVNGIITQLMAIERRPLQALETQETAVKAQLSTFGKLQDYVATMRDKASALTSLSLWNGTTGSSAAESVVTVSTGAAAAAGHYAVTVQQLAAGQTVSSRAFTSSSAVAFGEGTLTIEFGAWTGTPASGFAPKAGANAVTVTLGPEDNTLAKVRDKINAADAGVSASIINDASGARLAIRSKDSGAENAFRISAAETVDDGVAGDGLSALAFSVVGGATQMSRNQTAANALATVNGIAVESASNKLDNVSDGVNLELRSTSASAVDVNVALDTASVRTAITDFAKAFNELASYIREQTKYDPVTKKGGALQGDRAAIGLQGQLRAIVNESSSASGVFGRLTDIGLALKADGTFETKSGALENGLANLTELRKLLATDTEASATSGFMARFKRLGNAALGSDGTFETRSASLKIRITTLDKRQEQMQNRLAQTEKRLQAQYQTLDANMNRLSGLSGYVGQQLQALANFNRNN